MKNFKQAFDSGGGSCARQCECGKQFYNPDPSWDFEEGELEGYEKDNNTIALDYSVGCVEFEGRSYVYDCVCWHDRAKTIITFLDGHAYEIAEYLSLVKKQKTREAENSPVVK